MFIDTVNEPIKDKESLKKDLKKYKKEMIELNVQVTKLQASGKLLSHENDILIEKLSEMSNLTHKGRVKEEESNLS